MSWRRPLRAGYCRPKADIKARRITPRITDFSRSYRTRSGIRVGHGELGTAVDFVDELFEDTAGVWVGMDARPKDRHQARRPINGLDYGPRRTNHDG
jgi:hypothetical protein